MTVAIPLLANNVSDENLVTTQRCPSPAGTLHQNRNHILAGPGTASLQYCLELVVEDAAQRQTELWERTCEQDTCDGLQQTAEYRESNCLLWH